ncbi:ABC-F family ATP-binding cassette domain-containing protein [Aquimonas sp.]|jgi:ATP-binding cassette subfamily F protein 3|uniref:ABC-F family ATP-binding cassette domain-containing protein n=1 Tax=Aquimonas sp. TaxID=1872588 RepID=UPI0037BEF5B8
MIAFRNLALRRGERLLVSGLDMALHAGWRVGVIGRNGCGKSTLFAAIGGELEPDAGDIQRPGGLRMAAVAQETPSLPDPAIEFVLGGDREVHAALTAAAQAEAAGDHEAAATAHQRIEDLAGYDARARAGRLLHGLGFPADTHERPVASFSGGWRVRLNLARTLMTPAELLLLDEPTNHLDLDAVLWLEEWLKRFEGTVLVISHDREFLDGIATHTLHLHGGAGRLYSGDYSSFERQRAEHLRQQQIAHVREQAERARLQAFVDRFKAKASKAKQAQSRMKRLEKLAGTEAVRAERGFEFDFPQPTKLPTPLLRLDQVEAGYGTTTILSGVKFSMEPGDRIGMLGRNGAGKSTLVKTLAAEIAPLRGERIAHLDLNIGYFSQHTVEQLHAGHSPMQHLAEIAPRVGESVLRTYLGGWNFAGERVFEPVDGFSGGERARLALALIAYTKPNLLLLDEPTNHLDLDMREALADALAEYPGALVLVSHDRHLLGLVCDSYWRVADGVVAPFDGDLDDYAAWLRKGVSNISVSSIGVAAPNGESRADRRRSAAEQRERERPLRNRLKTVETKLERVSKELVALDLRLADPSLYASDKAEVARLVQTQGSLRAERESLEEEWLGLHEQLEA